MRNIGINCCNYVIFQLNFKDDFGFPIEWLLLSRDIYNFKPSLANDLKAQKQFKITNRKGLLVVPLNISFQKVFKYFIFNMRGCGYIDKDLVKGFDPREHWRPRAESFPFNSDAL